MRTLDYFKFDTFFVFRKFSLYIYYELNAVNLFSFCFCYIFTVLYKLKASFVNRQWRDCNIVQMFMDDTPWHKRIHYFIIFIISLSAVKTGVSQRHFCFFSLFEHLTSPIFPENIKYQIDLTDYIEIIMDKPKFTLFRTNVRFLISNMPHSTKILNKKLLSPNQYCQSYTFLLPKIFAYFYIKVE